MFKSIDIEPYLPDGELSCKLLPLVDDDEKIASCLGKHVPEEVLDFIKIAKSDANWVYLHIVAMTAGDFFGSNRNGDFFHESDLLGIQTPEEAAKNLGVYQNKPVPRYKTFLQGSFYHHHKNKPHLGHPRFGEVVIAVYNHVMHRVELIIKVYRKDISIGGIKYLGDPDTCDRAIKGLPIAFSMGTKVPGDFCSITGKFNKTVAEYGFYLKNMMGKILSDGRRVYAINKKPRFFDISKVTIPADLGYSIQKVASAETEVIPSAVLAIQYGMIDEDDKLALYKKSNMEKHVPEGKLIGTVSDATNVPVLAEVGSDISDHTLSMMANLPIKKALANALSYGIVMNPHEFGKMAAMRMDINPDFMKEEIDIDWKSSLDDDIARGLSKVAESRSAFKAYDRMQKLAKLSDDELLTSLGNPAAIDVYKKLDKPMPTGVTLGQLLSVLYKVYRARIRGGSLDQFFDLVARNPHVLPAIMLSGAATPKMLDDEVMKKASLNISRAMVYSAIPFIGSDPEKTASDASAIRHLKKTAALSKIELINRTSVEKMDETTKTAMLAVDHGIIRINGIFG